MQLFLVRRSYKANILTSTVCYISRSSGDKHEDVCIVNRDEKRALCLLEYRITYYVNMKKVLSDT